MWIGAQFRSEVADRDSQVCFFMLQAHCQSFLVKGPRVSEAVLLHDKLMKTKLGVSLSFVASYS